MEQRKKMEEFERERERQLKRKQEEEKKKEIERERQRIINEKREQEYKMVHGLADDNEFKEVNHRMDHVQLSGNNAADTLRQNHPSINPKSKPIGASQLKFSGAVRPKEEVKTNTAKPGVKPTTQSRVINDSLSHESAAFRQAARNN